MFGKGEEEEFYNLKTVGMTKGLLCKVMTHSPTPLLTKPQTLNHDKPLQNPGI